MITDGEDGYLIPVNNYSMFCDRLEHLMNDELLRRNMGSKAKETIKKFSINEIGVKVLRLLLLQI